FGLMQNVIYGCKMILEIEYGVLNFAKRPERAENDSVKHSSRSQPPQRKLKQRTSFQCLWKLQHAGSDVPFQVEIEGGAENQFTCCDQRKIPSIPIEGSGRYGKPGGRNRDRKLFPMQITAEGTQFLQHDHRVRARFAYR